MKNSKGMLYQIVDSKKLEEFNSFPCMSLDSNIVNIVHILQLVTVISDILSQQKKLVDSIW